MTYYAPDKVPYDEWFDPNYKYEPHPYDNWPVAVEVEEDSIHQKMYELATKNGTTVGGPENVQRT